MILNLLCYIMIDLFDIFGVMSFVGNYLWFDDADTFDPYD